MTTLWPIIGSMFLILRMHYSAHALSEMWSWNQCVAIYKHKIIKTLTFSFHLSPWLLGQARWHKVHIWQNFPIKFTVIKLPVYYHEYFSVSLFRSIFWTKKKKQKKIMWGDSASGVLSLIWIAVLKKSWKKKLLRNLYHSVAMATCWQCGLLGNDTTRAVHVPYQLNAEALPHRHGS